MAPRPAPATNANMLDYEYVRLPETALVLDAVTDVFASPGARTGRVKRDLHSLLRRLAMFGSTLATTVLDLVFIGAWIALQHFAHRIFEFVGSLPGMNAVVPVVLEDLFLFSTLIAVAAFVARDVWLFVKRVWRIR